MTLSRDKPGIRKVNPPSVSLAICSIACLLFIWWIFRNCPLVVLTISGKLLKTKCLMPQVSAASIMLRPASISCCISSSFSRALPG